MASGASVPLVGVTMGDPAGIGPELCLRVLREPAVLTECTPIVFGDAGVLGRVADACGLPPPETAIKLNQWEGGRAPRQPALVDCGAIDAGAVRPGEVQAACGKAAYAYIREAVNGALTGRTAGVATAPINKEAIRAAGIEQPGHTEILADLTGSPRVCMMLASEHLIVSMATTHIGFAQVPQRLSSGRVLEVIELTAATVARLRGHVPRIGVCGLNPHAGEHGLFGDREEERFIEPAIEAARAKGLLVEGPIPPDTAFVPSRRREVDAIVCMYHDQGHIPFKMLAFDTGVNITLGLPIVRVSVDHGTAFDIAWKGRASAESMIQAVLWTARLGSRHVPRNR
ncbi:MAG: 4-hydroxythreonine-4-phosphate dehydrogenase PdxA [Bryobacteraceae bacterium]|nr:4-hydroxythreonine-4-phosphate dehydrogenase PdxA [Bryobacteraceae bacterium]